MSSLLCDRTGLLIVLTLSSTVQALIKLHRRPSSTSSCTVCECFSSCNAASNEIMSNGMRDRFSRIFFVRLIMKRFLRSDDESFSTMISAQLFQRSRITDVLYPNQKYRHALRLTRHGHSPKIR